VEFITASAPGKADELGKQENRKGSEPNSKKIHAFLIHPFRAQTF
jgi:hypothetical protein